jgi:hypothetical protein
MSAPADPRDAGATVSPWRGTGPEIVIAVASIIVAAAAGYLMASWAGLSVAVTVAAAAAMVVLRFLLPALAPDEGKKIREKPQARPLSGYSHRRLVVHSAITSKGFYHGDLLAARLAERHGVHLYQDPEAARRLLCRHPRDADLWTWIDPRTRPETSARNASGERGIPRRTLARLIDRLERF